MIKRIRITDFKSIEDITVELGDVTVLVGRSGTGKTNFVNALRFLRTHLSDPQMSSGNVKWPDILPKGKQSPVMSFEVLFDIPGVDGSFEYRLSFGNHPRVPNKFVQEESLHVGESCLFHHDGSQWITEPAIVPVPKPANMAMLGELPQLPDAVIALTALTQGIGCYEFESNVLTGDVQAAQRRAGHSSDSNGSSGLQDNGANFLAVLKDIGINLQDLTVRKHLAAALRELNNTVKSAELNSTRSPTHIVVGHDFDGRTMSLNLDQESGGFRRFFAHLLALYQMPSKQLLVFEEPENGIYPGALSLLADEFKAAPQAGRGQVILTTHSPTLLDFFAPEQLRVVELVGQQTRIGNVSQEQGDAIRENLLFPSELLTVDEARIGD